MNDLGHEDLFVSLKLRVLLIGPVGPHDVDGECQERGDQAERDDHQRDGQAVVQRRAELLEGKHQPCVIRVVCSD